MKSSFNTFIEFFERMLLPYKYKKYKLKKNHYVYDFEDSAIYSVISIDDDGKEHIIVEEIFNSNPDNNDLKKACSQYTDAWVSYFKFRGKLGKAEPLKGDSQYEYINKELPDLEIDRRFVKWIGYSIPIAGFILKDGKKKGYAIVKCKYIDGIVELRNIGEYLISAYIDSKERKQDDEELVYGESRYSFIMDKNMCSILEKRYFSKHELPKMNNGFGISDLKGFWTFGYVHDLNEKPYEALKRLEKENYKDIGIIYDIYTEKMQENMPKFTDLFKKYFYVKVIYLDLGISLPQYSYISDDTTITTGDVVIVNRSGADTLALVMDAKYYKGYEVPFPVNKTKHIIKKIKYPDDLEKYGFSPEDFKIYINDGEEDDDKDGEIDIDDEDEIIDVNFLDFHRYYIITTLSDNKEIIYNISKMLLEKKLIASSQITVLESNFWWKGNIESKEEYKLELRTRDDKISEITSIIKEMHNYDIPEISSTRIKCLMKEMMEWIDESVTNIN